MKKIEAVIRPTKFEELKTDLNNFRVRGMTVHEVMGRGMQPDQKQYYRGREFIVDLFPKTKVEIICEDELVEGIIETIIRICNTGHVGDGKIFIYPVERIIRIRTGEEGDAAL